MQVLDLAATPVPHLTAEVLGAGYKAPDTWTPSEKDAVEKRHALVNQIIGAKDVTIVTGMMNWDIPSSLKAYIDNIIIPGTLDAYGCRKLAGKKITLFSSYGGYDYNEGASKWDDNFLHKYVKKIFVEKLGGEDFHEVATMLSLAGIAPGMEGFVEQKAKNIEAAKAAGLARAAAL